MHTFVRMITIVFVMVVMTAPAFASKTSGSVTDVSKNVITAEFPVPVKSRSMMIVMSGEGEAVAGMAVSETCEGGGPYQVRGKLSFVSDASSLQEGKKVYVNSANVTSAPSGTAFLPSPGVVEGDRDLRFYYYAAGQTAGYGAVGLGYERNIKLIDGVALQVDGALSGTSSLSASDPGEIDTDQVIKSLNGRLKFDFDRSFGFYAGYRWNEGQADDEHWQDVVENIEGKNFAAPSDTDSGSVLLQGLEYGLTLRPAKKFSLSLGYIPKYRVDYGGFGVRNEPGYSAELRFGDRRGIRLRGITSDDYWQADLGITIR